MWLPSDERRLLAGYCVHIGEVGESKGFPRSELCKLLQWWLCRPQRIWEYGDADAPRNMPMELNETTAESVNRYFNEINRLAVANKHLAERKLITITKHETEEVFFITLTIEGYDLGRKYANSWVSSGVWFHEYQNHWLWLIFATIGGGLLSKAIDWIGAWIAQSSGS